MPKESSKIGKIRFSTTHLYWCSDFPTSFPNFQTGFLGTLCFPHLWFDSSFEIVRLPYSIIISYTIINSINSINSIQKMVDLLILYTLDGFWRVHLTSVCGPLRGPSSRHRRGAFRKWWGYPSRHHFFRCYVLVIHDDWMSYLGYPHDLGNPPSAVFLSIPLLISYRQNQSSIPFYSPIFLMIQPFLSHILWILMTKPCIKACSAIWRFPKIGVPLVIIHFRGIFHEINHPAIGGSPFISHHFLMKYHRYPIESLLMMLKSPFIIHLRSGFWNKSSSELGLPPAASHVVMETPIYPLLYPLLTIWLVLWTPLKNMKVNWDDDIPNIWENKKWQPNHQPAMNFSMK